MPSKGIRKHLRGLLKHCLTSLPSRIGKQSKPVALEEFTAKRAVKDISFHVKAVQKTDGHKLVPKLTREHRAYIASKFDTMRSKVLKVPDPDQLVEKRWVPRDDEEGNWLTENECLNRYKDGVRQWEYAEHHPDESPSKALEERQEADDPEFVVGKAPSMAKESNEALEGIEQGPTVQDYQNRLSNTEHPENRSSYGLMHELLVVDALTVGEAYLFFFDYCQEFLTYTSRDTSTWDHFSRSVLGDEEASNNDGDFLLKLSAYGLVGIRFPKMEEDTFIRNEYKRNQYPDGHYSRYIISEEYCLKLFELALHGFVSAGKYENHYAHLMRSGEAFNSLSEQKGWNSHENIWALEECHGDPMSNYIHRNGHRAWVYCTTLEDAENTLQQRFEEQQVIALNYQSGELLALLEEWEAKNLVPPLIRTSAVEVACLMAATNLYRAMAPFLDKKSCICQGCHKLRRFSLSNGRPILHPKSCIKLEFHDPLLHNVWE